MPTIFSFATRPVTEAVAACQVPKPSVSRALAKLRADGYLLVDGNGYLRLTDKGGAIAEKIYERHHVLSELLTRIGVSPETAAEDACRIEHVISDESFAAIKQHVKEHS